MLSEKYFDLLDYITIKTIDGIFLLIAEKEKDIRNNPNAIIICERSVFTDKEVFAKMLYDDGKIEEVNYQIYLKWFDEFINDIRSRLPRNSLRRIHRTNVLINKKK